MESDRIASGPGGSGASLRVAQVPVQPPAATGYLTLLADALTHEEVQVVGAGPSDLWRIGRGREVNIAHLHWLEFIAPSSPGGLVGLLRTLVRQTRLLGALAWLRLRGIRLVWTVHNLGPHEPVRPRLESALAWAVSRLSDGLVAHSRYAQSRIQEQWGQGAKVVVIPHGNYIGRFPPASRSRRDVRRSRGTPDDAYVFLAFGQVRAYKRLTELVQAFAQLERDDVRLWIVGKPVGEDEADRLRQLAAADPRVRLDLRAIPDAEVAELHEAADAAVLAYRDVFSSGALLLALSFGLPVVAPDVGTAAELVGTEAGELFAPGALRAALDGASRADRPARAAAAAAVARRYGWDGVAQETTRLYRRLLGED